MSVAARCSPSELLSDTITTRHGGSSARCCSGRRRIHGHRPTHQVVLPARLTPYLENFPASRKNSNLGSVHHQLISDLCVHSRLLVHTDHAQRRSPRPGAERPGGVHNASALPADQLEFARRRGSTSRTRAPNGHRSRLRVAQNGITSSLASCARRRLDQVALPAMCAPSGARADPWATDLCALRRR